MSTSRHNNMTNDPAEPRLVGTWHLMSYEVRGPNGDVITPMGGNPQGQLIYDAAGNMSAHLMNPTPPERPRNAEDGAAYEARISYDRYTSYFGRYSVDTDRSTVTHHLTGALMPGWAGTPLVRRYRLDSEDKLTISAEAGPNGESAVLMWTRAG